MEASYTTPAGYDTTTAPRVCRGCGCTDEDGCLVEDPSELDRAYAGCHWVERDLCSGCKWPEHRLSGPLRDRRAAPPLRPDECPHRNVSAIAEGYGGYGCHDCGAWFDTLPVG